MATLLLACVGPMQSWGVRSRYDERGTEREPSKSGIIGMLCAAIGRDRSQSVEDFAKMKMGVRIDREGTVRYDYQTAQNVLTAKGKGTGNVVSKRWYLSDAAFLVGIEGKSVEQERLLRQVYETLRTPKWPLSLGRKSYLPSRGPYIENGLTSLELRKALERYPWLSDPVPEAGTPIRFVYESETQTEMIRYDNPIDFNYTTRRFRPRYLRYEWRNADELPIQN